LSFFIFLLIMCNIFMFISFQRTGRREGSTIILKRQESWTIFWEIFTIKFSVAFNNLFTYYLILAPLV
jgi:hypothetical protein